MGCRDAWNDPRIPIVLICMVGHISIVLASLGVICAAAAVYALVWLPAPQRKGRDLYENVLWGKLFIAATYASIAVVAFLAIGKMR